MKILSLIIALSFICSVSVLFFWKQSQNHCRIPSPQGDWSFELARTAEEQSRGLMGRSRLCANCGMMFLFAEEAPLSFWMKDTRIPLDIYFYNAQGRLVDLVRNMRPESETGEPMVYHARSAQFAVEVPQGSFFPANTVDILHCQ